MPWRSDETPVMSGLGANGRAFRREKPAARGKEAGREVPGHVSRARMRRFRKPRACPRRSENGEFLRILAAQVKQTEAEPAGIRSLLRGTVIPGRNPLGRPSFRSLVPRLRDLAWPVARLTAANYSNRTRYRDLGFAGAPYGDDGQAALRLRAHRVRTGFCRDGITPAASNDKATPGARRVPACHPSGKPVFLAGCKAHSPARDSR